MIKIKFSKIELRDLAKAWLIISIAFAIVLSGGVLGTFFIANVILSAVTVGVGFLLHEMGHKIVAQRYGCFAEFRADNFMLLVAVLTSFLGVVFAAPGAVMIAGHVGKERNGKISLAGPATNLVLAILFIGLAFIFTEGFIARIISFGVLVNVWLGLFNLIPVWLLDGKKILKWNKLVYFITLGIGIFLFVIRYYLPLAPLF
ncbi:MAG: peptidase M50 [Candidatus Pacebacteria bacterium]|jgi:Zn-dependent protease|nr:peptidase M50 [Candidatus Paceibacterota bacterium]